MGGEGIGWGTQGDNGDILSVFALLPKKGSFALPHRICGVM